MFFLAIRHLISRKKQTFLIFLGIVLGTMVYITIAGMQFGFQDFIVEQLVENDAHIKISAHEEVITPDSMKDVFYPQMNGLVQWHVSPFGKRNEAHIVYPQGWFEKLQNDPDVFAYSEQLSTQVIVTKGSIKLTASLLGVNPEKQMRTTIIRNYITDGKFETLGTSGNRIAIGSGLLQKLGAQLNDTVYLTGGTQAAKPFKITCIFHLGVHEVDDNMIFGALRDVQNLNGTPGRISQIAVKLHDVKEASQIANSWQQISRDKVLSWDKASANFLQVFKIQDIFRIFITAGIFVIVSFGIYNVLSIIVTQKRREIAILQALGYEPKDILKLFSTQGVILGAAGAIAGVLVGYLMCVYLKNLDISMMGKKGLTISFRPSIYFSAFSMSCASSILSSILPAFRASRYTPIDIIRMDS
jgi:lipoprotein-releasing system permease protein